MQSVCFYSFFLVLIENSYVGGQLKVKLQSLIINKSHAWGFRRVCFFHWDSDYERSKRAGQFDSNEWMKRRTIYKHKMPVNQEQSHLVLKEIKNWFYVLKTLSIWFRIVKFFNSATMKLFLAFFLFILSIAELTCKQINQFSCAQNPCIESFFLL